MKKERSKIQRHIYGNRTEDTYLSIRNHEKSVAIANIVNHRGRRVLQEGRPVIFYLHPRELDPEQPRLHMKTIRKIKSYINLNTTENKLRSLVNDFDFMTIEQYLEKNEIS